MNTKISIWILTVLFALSAAPAMAGEIEWLEDLDKGLELAKKEDKPVMIDFWAPWCAWCKKLDQDTFTDEGVTKLAELFVPVKVNTDDHPDIAAKYGVMGLPTVLFLSPNGKEFTRSPGFMPAGPFADMQQQVLDGKFQEKEMKAQPQGGGAATPQENPMSLLADKMKEVKDAHLDHYESGPIVQKKMETIIAQLDKWIDEARQEISDSKSKKQQQQQQQSQQKSQAKSKPGGKPGSSATTPMQQSQAKSVAAGGALGDRGGDWGAKWGSLPPREREELLNKAGAEGLPPEYLEYLKKYYSGE